VGLDRVRETLEGACGGSTHPWQHNRRVPDSSAGPKPSIPEYIKAFLKVVVAAEQPLEDQRALTGKIMAKIGFYTHRAQAERALLSGRGPKLLIPLPLDRIILEAP
jgi:hypothetical protein